MKTISVGNASLKFHAKKNCQEISRYGFISSTEMMMMNCFYGILDRQKEFQPISSRDYCQRFSPLQFCDWPRAGFEPAQNLSSGFGQ